MGNQYSVSSTDQIYPIEHYFAELPTFALVSKLGSTRFMKVAKAAHSEGPCVVKIFVIHDRSLNLDVFERLLTFQRESLQTSMHCLPFSYYVNADVIDGRLRNQGRLRSDRSAALCRTFLKDTLYDRMSTRPYLTEIEKKWIAFQILSGLQECHDKNICHGDLKTENVAVTSWNWVYLTDFACYKPTYLPDADPADFSYYFDTSRRRTCYVAPERFVSGVVDAGDLASSKASLPEQQQEARMGALHWSMDIFSVGCLLLEFFCDGEAPFDLSKLLMYRSGEFYPTDSLNKVDNPELRTVIEHMIQKDPSKRHSAGEYLRLLRGTYFPEWFYSYLNAYVQSFSIPSIPDEKMTKLRRDVPGILEKFSGENSDCLVVILSLLLANWRNLSHSDAKLAALDVAEMLAPLLPVDIVLDRLLPYLLTCAEDRLPIVRTCFIVTFCKILQTIPSIRRNEGHIFRAYILPDMEQLVEDSDQQVRVTFAMHVAELAEIGMRFLELSYLSPSSSSSQDLVYGLHDEDRYPFDVERMLLLRHFQSILERLILKPSNLVKRALLEHGLSKLCQVFGRKLTREIILPHLVTFLNERPDWQLRAAFFKSIVGLASFVGLEGAAVFRALLEQGLTDPEEFVVFFALCSFLDLVKLQLMPKKSVTELLSFCAALLVHPNTWIRRTAVLLFVTSSKKTDFVGQQIRIRPILLPFLHHPTVFLDSEETLLGALLTPISRRLYAIFTEGRAGRRLLDFLHEHSDARLRMSPDNEAVLKSQPAEFSLYQNLHSKDISEVDKTKALLIRDFISKLRLPSQSMEKVLSSAVEEQAERTKNTVKMGQNEKIQLRAVPELSGFEGPEALSASGISRGKINMINDFMLRAAMSEEWDAVFGPNPNAPTQLLSRPPSSLIDPSSSAPVREPSTGSRDISLLSGAGLKHVRIPSCERAVQRFVKARLQEKAAELSNEVSLTDMEVPPDSLERTTFRPSGVLVAHLHEHHNSVVRLRSNKTNGDVLSCCLDGTVKLWDCAKMAGRGMSNRAKYTYKGLSSPVRAITYCEEWKSFACAGENGTIHVVRLDADHSKGALKLEKFVDPNKDGIIVEMQYCDPGSQSIITFATSMGLLAGWDLRTPNFVWKLQSDRRYGMIKTFCVSQEQSWMTTGSLDGYMVTWDLRFRIPIATLHHPAAAAINRLYTHPKVEKAVITCVKGNNEVSVWDTETGLRTFAVWSGATTPLAPSPQNNTESIRGLQVIGSDFRRMSFVSGGTDRRIRLWDGMSVDQSYTIAAATGESLQQKKLMCRPIQIDGIDVIHEYQSNVRSLSTSTSFSASDMKDAEAQQRPLADSPAIGHSDAVNDIVISVTQDQPLLVTGSRDGIIKVWK